MSIDFSKLEAILASHPPVSASLIPVLQGVEEEFGYVSEEASRYVARKLQISPSKVYGILTFYAQFHLQPTGRNMLRVCCGTACHVQGADRLLNTIRDKLQINHSLTTSDNKFTLQEVRCVGCCSLAPVLMVNDDVHGKVTTDNLEDILNNVE